MEKYDQEIRELETACRKEKEEDRIRDKIKANNREEER